MSSRSMSLAEAKQSVSGLGIGGERQPFRYAPMFLPVDATTKKGTGVIKVVTRQKFLDENIGNWVRLNLFRFGFFGLGALAILLLAFNIFLSAAAAVGAGYCYGEYTRKEFIVEHLLKNRWLLEGT